MSETLALLNEKRSMLESGKRCSVKNYFLLHTGDLIPLCELQGDIANQ